MHILDCRPIKTKYEEILRKRVESLDFKPGLAVIQIGTREDSTSYIKSKKFFATKIGVNFEHITFPDNVSENEVRNSINLLNKRGDIHGIILQLPIPVSLPTESLLNAISSSKDVDALSFESIANLWYGKETKVIPAVSRGIINLCKEFSIDLDGKEVAIIGRSSFVGKPIFHSLLRENAIVTVCHSHSKDLKRQTKDKDILILATGKAGIITKEFVSQNQIVIDVGISKVEGVLRGDALFEEVEPIVKSITPVPGGVGQMTVVALFENLLDLATK